MAPWGIKMPYADPERRKAFHRQYYIMHKDYWDRLHEWQRTSGWQKEYNRTPERIESNKGYRRKRIAFGRKKRVFLDSNPRTGQCTQCLRRVGEGIKVTGMHHAKGYYMIFPWFGIVELCGRCHVHQHR